MICGGRIYKGQDNYIELYVPDASGITGIEIYTGGDLKIIPEYEVCGDDLICINLSKDDIDPLDDGVIYYTVYRGEDGQESNTSYYLKTPVGYTATTIQELIEDAYQSGYTDGYDLGYLDGYDTGYTEGYESGYTAGFDECNHDYSADYLTIETLEDGVFYVRNSGYDYSINNGEWETTTGETPLSLSQGDKVRFKSVINTNHTALFAQNTMSFKVYGNIESLEYGIYFSGQTSARFSFSYLFAGSSGITDVSNLVLPATTLKDACYQYMFSGCTGITTPPELPATALTSNCYESMFFGCTSLTTAPALPATTLASRCYCQMFFGCSNLVSAPTLPATILASSCYETMFASCTGLTTPPELPATALADYCYGGMFYGCTSLTTAPTLPATTLADYCYSGMFSGCTGLGTAPELPATTLSRGCYANLFSNCTGLTTASELPAVTLSETCYSGMFKGCTSLISAPALPAINLEPKCYRSMFSGCTSLTTAPELPATILVSESYNLMFSKCTSLDYIKCLATDVSASACVNGWVLNVSSTGTFVKNPAMTDWRNGNNGIPFNWIVVDAS